MGASRSLDLAIVAVPVLIPHACVWGLGAHGVTWGQEVTILLLLLWVVVGGGGVINRQ